MMIDNVSFSDVVSEPRKPSHSIRELRDCGLIGEAGTDGKEYT